VKSTTLLAFVLFAVVFACGCSDGEATVEAYYAAGDEQIRVRVGDSGMRTLSPGYSTTFDVNWDGGVFSPGEETVECYAELMSNPSNNTSRQVELEDGDRYTWTIYVTGKKSADPEDQPLMSRVEK